LCKGQYGTFYGCSKYPLCNIRKTIVKVYFGEIIEINGHRVADATLAKSSQLPPYQSYVDLNHKPFAVCRERVEHSETGSFSELTDSTKVVLSTKF
jgi:hypothetical protein